MIKTLQLLFLTILCLFVSQAVKADSVAPIPPHKMETADKKYLLVLLNCAKPECLKRLQSISYKQSGLYLNDNSANPIWTVDWEGQAYLPADGIHVVKQGDWADFSGVFQEEAFSFYSQGALLRTYQTRDLIDFPWLLPHSMSHYEWRNSKCLVNDSKEDETTIEILRHGDKHIGNQGIDFDSENQTFRISTLLQDEFLFDLRTGKMLSAHHPSRYLAITFSVLFLTVYLVIRFIIRNNKFVSNTIFGLIFLLAILIIPTFAASLSFVSKACYQYIPSFQSNLFSAVFYFPVYILSLINIRLPIHADFTINFDSPFSQFLILSFWLVLFLSFALIDHLIANSIGAVRRRRNNHLNFR